MPCLAKTLIEGPEKYIKTIFADNEMLEDKYYREIMEWILKWIEEDDYNAIKDFCEETPDIKLRGILKAFLEKEELKEYGEEYLKDKDDVKDSKLEQLDVVVNTKLIPENGYVMKKRHMVIFAHYIATCNHIFEHFRRVCDDDTKIYLATGENTKQEIDQSIEEFKQTCKDDIYDSIMICSDVCLEGKNMQECQVLINYDLPFSSSIMQQRIDRINRNGQKNTPLVFNLLCNVDSDIHTYYKIIFEKIRLINGISGICGINVIRETNEEVQNQVIEEWKNAAINAQKDYENDLSALQNGYLKYLRREISKIKAFGASEGIVAEEIKKAEHYSDEEVLNKMRYILFTAPKEELKSIREEAHSVGKEEVGVKIFGADFSKGSSIRKMSIEYIHGVLKPFIENGIIEYIADTDTYVLNISEIKYDFLQTVIREQVFEYFTNLENPDGDKGQLDMYYDEAHITFATAVYKEIGTAEDINGKSLGVFEEIVGDTFDDMYISLTPLCDVLKQCI